MKLFWPFFFLISFSAFASPSKIIKCLAQEEKHNHLNKVGGPFYELNRSMISYIVQFPDELKFQPKFQKEICEEKYASFHLLRLLMIHNEKILVKSTDSQSRVSVSSPESLANSSLNLFRIFLSHYQAGLKNANCLEKRIPELKVFYKKILYLEEEISQLRLINELGNIDILFDKLLNPKLTQDC